MVAIVSDGLDRFFSVFICTRKRMVSTSFPFTAEQHRIDLYIGRPIVSKILDLSVSQARGRSASQFESRMLHVVDASLRLQANVSSPGSVLDYGDAFGVELLETYASRARMTETTDRPFA